MQWNKNSKIIFTGYKLLCNLYSFISTKLENKFLRKKIYNNQLNTEGYFKYASNKMDFDRMLKCKFIRDNKYKSTRLLNEEQIIKLIKYIFNNDLRKFMSGLSGFNYSIDHFWMYDREHININDKKKQWYAHEYHFDKPYSQNMLKIFIPLNISHNEGALSLLNKFDSKNLNFKNLKQNNFIFLKGNSNFIYGFLPNVCWHKDGIPKEGEIATQIMFQLNPSKTWSINSNLFKRQLTMEGRFPFFSYLFDRRMKFREII